MRRLHLVTGILTIIAFLITGQLMRHHSPPMGELSDSLRLLYRSRHIYILGSGLMNLMLGLYVREMRGWRRVVQWFGSVPVLLAPLLLIYAYAVEPGAGFHEDMAWSRLGLFAMFDGGLMHLVAGFERNPKRFDAGADPSRRTGAAMANPDSADGRFFEQDTD